MSRLTQRFRPMSFGDIIDEAFDLYKTNFVLLVGIGAIINVPLNFLSGALSAEATARGPFWFMGTGDFRSGGTSSVDALAPVLLAIFVTYPIVTAAFTYAISQRYLGEITSIGRSYGYVLRRIGAVLWTMLLLILAAGGIYIGTVFVVAIVAGLGLAAGGGAGAAGIVVIVLFVLAAVALIAYVIARMLLAFAVLMVEGHRGFAALNRSWRLSKGFGWRIVGIVLVTLVVVTVMEVTLESAVSPLVAAQYNAGNIAVAQAVSGAASAVSGAFLAPVMSILLVMLYYDLRIRKEGFDLQMLARDLAATSGQPSPEQEA